MASATLRPFRSLMSATTTLAPSAAKRRAIPSPNPEPAPVTIATLSLRRTSVLRFAVVGNSLLEQFTSARNRPLTQLRLSSASPPPHPPPPPPPPRHSA